MKRMRMGTSWLFFSIILSIFACTDKQLNRNEGSSEQGQTKNALPAVTERPSEDNGGLPGYPLACQSNQAAEEQLEIDCNLMSKSGDSPLDLSREFATWDFSLVYKIQDISLDITKRGRAREGFQVSWLLQAEQPISMAALRDHIQVNFRAIRADAVATRVEANWDLASSEVEELPPESPRLAAYRFYRIMIYSIEFSEFATPNACIQYLQLYFNDAWQPASIDDQGIVSISGQTISFNASSNLDFVHDAFFVPSFWESVPGSYQNVAPFDATPEPSWFSFGFNAAPVALQGIRILGGDPNFVSGECAPDQVGIQGSNDQQTWQSLGQTIYPIQSNFSMTEIFW